MSVRRLAKFDIRIPETVLLTDVRSLFYLPNVGLVAECGAKMHSSDPAASQGTGVIAPDGIFRDRCKQGNFRGYIGWWPAEACMIEMWDEYLIPGNPDLGEGEYENRFDPYVFARQRSKPFGVETPGVYPFTKYVRMADRNVAFDTSISQFVGIDADGNVTPEGPVIPFYNFEVIGAGRTNTEVFLAGHSIFPTIHMAVFYDTQTKDLSSPYYYFDGPTDFGTEVARYFAPELGVFFSVHPPEEILPSPLVDLLAELPSETPPDSYYKLCVWSMEVNPTFMSDVEVVDGEVKSGQVVTYRVQVLGSQDDPAEGELVDWAISGSGELLAIQSKTDAEGYASVKVLYGLGETDQSVIEASLKC